MASWTWTSAHHGYWQRLLALLIALSFAFTILSSHAAADACQVDCAEFQSEMLDTEESCGTGCAIPVAFAPGPLISPHPLPRTTAFAVDTSMLQPPRRPPRA